MAKGVNLGDLMIGIQLRTKALEQGLNEVKRQMNKHGNDIRKTGAEYDKLAIVAGIAFWKITGSIKQGVAAYNEFNNSMVGLRSTVQGTGNDFNKAQQFIENFTRDGLVPASNAAAGLKNLLTHGFAMDQAVEVMNRFKDSAAFARQGSLSMGQAIQGATEGLKNSMSMMVDNAGVTENLSIMWEKYAATIGKTANELTDAEKVQAEYVGIMRATQFQVGDAAKYAQEFAGAQARTAQETLKLKQALGGALVPTFYELLSLFTPLITALTKFISTYPELTSLVVLSVTAFTGLITVLTSLKAATILLGPALSQLKVALLGIVANPYVLAFVTLATAIGYTAIQVNKAKREQEAYNAAVERFEKIKNSNVTKAEAPQLKGEAENIENLIAQYDKLKKKYDELSKLEGGATGGAIEGGRLAEASEGTGVAVDKLSEAFKKAGINFDFFNGGIEDAQAKLKILRDAIREAEKATLDELNSNARTIAEKKSNITQTEQLIKTYRNAAKGSKEWNDAQQKLADQFPQFSTASGIIIDAIEGVTKAENANVSQEWKNLQDKAKIAAQEIQLEVEKEKAKLSALEASRNAMIDDEAMTKGLLNRLTRITAEIAAQRALLDGDMSALEALEALSKSTADGFKGVKPIDVGSYSTSYENKAMDSALKVMEHKKRMDQLSLEDEVLTLNTILQKYAKTADEKMQIEEKLYDAKKALLDRDKKANEDYFDSIEEAIKNRTDASFSWIDNKKAYDDLSGTEEIAAYERMIKYHREYLNERMKDNKLEKEQKDKIYASEMVTIQDLERKIFDVRKSYVEQAVNEYISRKQKQYDWEEQQERDRLNKKLSDLEKEYAAKERELDAEDREAELDNLYEEEKKYLDAATEEGKNRLKQIQDDIKRLNREAEKEQLQEEKANRKEAIEDEISDNEKKYSDLKNNLETSQSEMLAAASEFAKESNAMLTDATSTFSDSLLNVFKTFDANNDNLMKQGLDKLRSFVNEYTKLLKQVQLNPANIMSGNNNLTLAAAGNGGNTYQVNDYGTKIINSKDEAIDYTQELFGTAKNMSRGLMDR